MMMIVLVSIVYRILKEKKSTKSKMNIASHF